MQGDSHLHALAAMPPKFSTFARLAGFGAFAACGGIAALFLLFVYVTRPTSWSGMDATTRILAWGSVAGVALALLGVHLLFARELLALAKGEPRRP